MERPLGPFEHYLYCRTIQKAYSNFRVGAQYSQPLSEEAVFRALHRMVYSHTGLSLGVVDSGKDANDPKLRVLDSFTFGDVFSVSSEPIERLIESRGTVFFTYNDAKPLWRVVLVGRRELVFYCDHIGFDGNAGLNFHKLFAQALRDTAKDPCSQVSYKGLGTKLFDVKETGPDFTAGPTAKSLLCQRVSPLRVLYEATTHLLPKPVARLSRKFFNGSPYRRLMNFSVRALPPAGEDHCAWVHVTPQRVEQLLQLARAHNVKLTALLQGLALIAGSPFLGTQDNILSFPYNMRHTVDVDRARKTHPLYTPDFGVLIGFQYFEFPPVQALFPNDTIDWTVIATIDATIHKGSHSALETLNLFRIQNAESYVREEQEKLAAGHLDIPSFLISNLGRLGDPDIVDMWFDQNIDGQIFGINAVSCNGGLRMSIRSHVDEWLPPFAARFENLVNTIS